MLESLRPEVAGGNSKMLWTLALVLEFLFDGKSLMHGWRLESFCKSIKLNIHFLYIFFSIFLFLLGQHLLFTSFFLLLFLSNCNFWIWLWFLFFLVSFWSIFDIGSDIQSCFKCLSPDIVTECLLFQGSSRSAAWDGEESHHSYR